MFSILDILFFFLPGRHHHNGYGYSNYGCRDASEFDSDFRMFGVLLGWVILAVVVVAALYAFVPNFHIPLVERYLPISVGS